MAYLCIFLRTKCHLLVCNLYLPVMSLKNLTYDNTVDSSRSILAEHNPKPPCFHVYKQNVYANSM